jgi:MoaD family protein
MPKVTCKYFTTVLNITNKDEETFEINQGTTVDVFLNSLVKKYGEKFSRNVYSEGTIEGKSYRTPNLYLNKSRIQWVQDFPEGLKTKLKDGDVLWLGLIVGGGTC